MFIDNHIFNRELEPCVQPWESPQGLIDSSFVQIHMVISRVSHSSGNPCREACQDPQTLEDCENAEAFQNPNTA